MHATPDQYLVRNKNTTKNMSAKTWEDRARKAWNMGGLLHITEKVQLDVVRVFAIRTNSKSISSAWHTLVPKFGDPPMWSKAMVVYLNSTLGAVAILGTRTFKKLPYPRWGVDNIKSIPVPILDEKKTKILADAYDKYADHKLGLLRQPTNVRGALDEAVSKALGVPSDQIAYTRLELSKEPMVTAKQYKSSTLD